MRIIYVNGEFLPENQAKISVFDRGFLFADSVYEVSFVMNGQLVDNQAHIARLRRSLSELDMVLPMTDKELQALQKRLVAVNKLEQGSLYLQVSRGIEDRNFNYSDDLIPSVVMFTQAASSLNSSLAQKGIRVKTIEDLRWHRRDIKTTMLLAQSMAKKQASKLGYDDAWLVSRGVVNEGSSNNVFIITNDNEIYTRKPTNKILNGITRRAVIKLAQQQKLIIIEEKFTIKQAQDAKEVFATSATFFVMPVVEVDDVMVADGKPGKLTQRLRSLYINMATSS